MTMLNKALIAVVLFLAVVSWYYQRQAEYEHQRYIGSQVANGVLVHERDMVWSRYLEQSKTITALQQDSAFRDLRIRELLDVVKQKDGTIKSLTAFAASWRPDTVTIAGQIDTIYTRLDTKRLRVSFDTEIQGDNVSGWTLTNPPEAQIRLTKRPVAFAVALVERKDGAYETVITTDNPWLTISAASGKVIPYQKTRFWGLFSGPALSIGWTDKRALRLTADARVWKITPFLECDRDGLDYGAKIKLWELKW